MEFADIKKIFQIIQNNIAAVILIQIITDSNDLVQSRFAGFFFEGVIFRIAERNNVSQIFVTFLLKIRMFQGKLLIYIMESC